jgi:hypothetical protein
MIDLDDLPEPSNVYQPDHDTLMVRQHAFGYTNEDIKLLLTPMAVNGMEGLGSMGTDTPLACLSEKPQLLYNYFRQLFAQVTNPPLDANFEELVTSLYTYLGREGNLLSEDPKACHLIKLQTPILSNHDLEKLREVATGELKAHTIPILFNVLEGEAGPRPGALMESVRGEQGESPEGASILILFRPRRR